MTGENNILLLEHIINEIITYYDDLDTINLYVGSELYDTAIFVVNNYHLYFTPVITFYFDENMNPLEHGFTRKKELVNNINDLYYE